MRTNRRRVLSLFATVGLAVAALVVFTAISAESPEPEASAEAIALFTAPVEDPFAPVARPPRCCDPALEPGAGGNPFCFEGHTCCSDGRWRCNEPDATPSCSAGVVCSDNGCAERNESCDSDDDCCSGDCKRNGRCK